MTKTRVAVFFRIYVKLGSGLLESVYEEVICHELTSEG